MLILKRKAGQSLLIGAEVVRFFGVSYDSVSGVHVDSEGNITPWSLIRPQIGDKLEFGVTIIRVNNFDETGHGVILAIDAPREVHILRGELV
jgi:sRNA-binding carbon storage regulator CsrA